MLAQRPVLSARGAVCGASVSGRRGVRLQRQPRHPPRRASSIRASYDDSFDSADFDSFDSFDEERQFAAPVMVGEVVDYYQLLRVDPAATQAEIKRAYYGMAKECHPDLAGDGGHNMCVLLNSAYDTLSDENDRYDYDVRLHKARADTVDGFTGLPVSKWEGPAEETRALFVDEMTCIGCKNCVWQAPATFRIEPDYGRSQVFAQWLNKEDDLQAAVESCPVDCIHWVERDQLPVLEHVMATMDRVGVASMQAGQVNAGDVFDAAARFAKRRAEKAAEEAKERKESAAQAAARQKAAADIMRKTGGWGEKMGKRWGWGAATAGSSRRSGRENTVPLDRSIVPAAYKEKQ